MSNSSAAPATLRCYDSYDGILKLSIKELQQAIQDRGLFCFASEKVPLQVQLLNNVVGSFQPVDSKVGQQQTELLQGLATQMASVKETLDSLKATGPSPQQPQLMEGLQQLKEDLEGLKGNQEGWRTLERKITQQADAPQRQKRQLNATLRNFKGKEDENVEAAARSQGAQLTAGRASGTGWCTPLALEDPPLPHLCSCRWPPASPAALEVQVRRCPQRSLQGQGQASWDCLGPG